MVNKDPQINNEIKQKKSTMGMSMYKAGRRLLTL